MAIDYAVAKRAARANSKGSDSTSAVLALRKGPIYDPKHPTQLHVSRAGRETAAHPTRLKCRLSRAGCI